MPYVEMTDRNGKAVARFYTSRLGKIIKRRKQKKNNEKAAAILRRLLAADEKDLPEVNIEFTEKAENERGREKNGGNS